MTKLNKSVESNIASACRAFQSGIVADDVIRAAERCVLDWLGCAFLGATLPAAKGVARALDDELGNGVALELTRPSLTSVGNAALINGTAAHVAELDDIYSPAIYHPGAPVIAAALAAAQSTNASGAEFLRAVIAGYEVSNRIGTAVNPAHYEYWHTTGTIGTLGAATAVGTILRLTEEELGWALGHAASMAAGLQQAFRSDGMTKPLHAGRAAEGGVLAARLAGAGVTGASGMLSGLAGLGKAMSHDVDWATAVDGLFTDFTIERTTFKRFAACGHTFAAVDAVLDMLEERPIDPKTVKLVTVDTYAKAIDVAGNPQPQTPFEARFSIEFGVAAALCGRDLTRSMSYDDDIQNAELRRVMSCVHVRSSEAVNAQFPQLRGAWVLIELENGERREGTVHTRKGDPANPLSDDELSRKFEQMMAQAGKSPMAAVLVSWVRSLRESDAAVFGRFVEYSAPNDGGSGEARTT